MPKRTLWLCIAVALMGPASCTDRAPVDVAALQAAKTAQEEAKALKALRKDATTLGFIARDADKKKLPGADAPWPDRVVSVSIRVDGQIVEHVMIDPENVSRLLGE